MSAILGPEQAATPEGDAGSAREPGPIAAPIVPRVGRRRIRRDLVGLSFLVAGAVALATPWVAYFGNLGFAPLIGGAGVLSLPVFLKTRRPLPGVWFLLALLVWGIISYAWSPLAPAAGQLGSLKALQKVTGLKLAVELVLYGAFVMNMGRLAPGLARLSGQAMSFGLLAMAALVLIDGLGHATIYQHIRDIAGAHARPDLAIRDVSRAGFVLVMLFWPTVLILVRDHRRWAAIAFAALVTAVTLVFRTDAALLSLVASTVVAGAIWRFGRLGAWLLLAGVAALFVLTPLAVMLVQQGALTDLAHSSVSKASWGERLKIWSFALRLIEVRPFQGWGLDASRAWPGLIPLHPHNVALQLWLELGVVGAALAALFWTAVIGRIDQVAQADRALGAVCGGVATAFLADGAVGFGVWQDWWLAIGALATAWCLIARAFPPLEPGARALQPL